MSPTQIDEKLRPQCTLCPAGCEVHVVTAGPDTWRPEYPVDGSRGLCPRGSSLPELLSHRHRIYQGFRREAPIALSGDSRPRVGGGLEAMTWRDAAKATRQAAGARDVVLMVDANLPCEQLRQIALVCRQWEGTALCLITEPAEEQLLLGTEASGADYLRADELAACDGFLMVGDPFAANPLCSRPVLDRRRAEPRTPIVAIDPAAGMGVKFATIPTDVGPGRELPALAQLARVLGVQSALDLPGTAPPPPSVDAAGRALAGCTRLGVIVAAEYGRGTDWRCVGYLAGEIAIAKGGGLSVSTVGANALAAVRLSRSLGTVSLSEALSREGVPVAIGCDPLGVLGWPGEKSPILAAAAALPNVSTREAQIILPMALGAELNGTYLLDGARATTVGRVMPPPAGVPDPADLVAELAGTGAAGEAPSDDVETRRSSVDPPEPAGVAPDAQPPVLLLKRKAAHSGSGELTGHASWQLGVHAAAELRISPAAAARRQLMNLQFVDVCVGRRSVRARVVFAPELGDGVVTLPEGLAAARALLPARADAKTGVVGAAPATVALRAVEAAPGGTA